MQTQTTTVHNTGKEGHSGGTRHILLRISTEPATLTCPTTINISNLNRTHHILRMWRFLVAIVICNVRSHDIVRLSGY